MVGKFSHWDLLSHVQLQADLLIQLQLHHQERVPGLTLAQRRVQTEHDQCVSIVILGKQEEFFDGGILNLIVICLSAKTEGRFVHIDIEPTSAK